MGKPVIIIAPIVVAGAILSLYAIPSGRLKIEAGAITQPVPGSLEGSFTIRRTYVLEYRNGWPFVLMDGVTSQGTGGACLVAHPADIGVTELAGRSCSRNADCAMSNRPGWSAYCDDLHQCWVRPGPPSPPLCNRSRDYTPLRKWALDVPHPANRTPLDATVQAAGSVRWRAVACLNGLAPGGAADSSDCGTPDGPNRLEVMGPISSIPRN